MRYRVSAVRTAMFVAMLAISLSALAQQHPNEAKGFAPDKIFNSNGPDTVNTFNGNLAISIPIGPRYQVSRTLSYGLDLFYNARPWITKLNDPYVQVLPDHGRTRVLAGGCLSAR